MVGACEKYSKSRLFNLKLQPLFSCTSKPLPAVWEHELKHQWSICTCLDDCFVVGALEVIMDLAQLPSIVILPSQNFVFASCTYLVDNGGDVERRSLWHVMGDVTWGPVAQFSTIHMWHINTLFVCSTQSVCHYFFSFSALCCYSPFGEWAAVGIF